MDAASMKELLKRRGVAVELWLASCLDDRDMPPRLREAMLYSLQAGGKRLRPVLCITCAELCGLEELRMLPFAGAIEMIHTYSLIHDDLPAMDDDDLRRGKPSNHKAFDEATAILAGDGLLTDAFGAMCRARVPARPLLAAIAEIAMAAGSSGMVGGQEWDMIHTGRPSITLEELQTMHAMKTGALLRASCVCGALLAEADRAVIDAIGEYGSALGMAFQIADDILDVTGDTAVLGKPAGSDAAQGKNTYPSMVGLAQSRELALAQAARAKAALAPFTGQEAAFLRALADYTVSRAC
ncbi:MAG: polyprenyl synthetase family protein [Desulfovibrio sp.]|uniref:polyprenyl synthetase family protein n=1 Tax=Desulfovibrio sp. TaxID=885 RepID=UPI001A7A5980|nr:farnesyl diphosphate synthase [Desulfovibrio sp.]MBD5417841.1 polyprenyl synthetase family protein [Desulfovibrio sp.]